LITATALVQPGKTLAEVTADSVLRKMKKKEFARSVNRDEIEEGARELGIPLEEHVDVRARGAAGCGAEPRTVNPNPEVRP
jgi:predicted hydrolase (HD superfamily)